MGVNNNDGHKSLYKIDNNVEYPGLQFITAENK